MTKLVLRALDDHPLRCEVHADGRRIGEVRSIDVAERVLELEGATWSIVDEGWRLAARPGRGLFRAALGHALRPAEHTLRDASGGSVLAWTRRRWRWSGSQDGLAVDLGGQHGRLRSLGAWGGRFAFEADGLEASKELRFANGLAVVEWETSLPAHLAVFLMHSLHRSFGRDPREASSG